MQQLLGEDGVRLRPAHLLHLATRAGARALGLWERVGDLSPGKDFDAAWVSPSAGSTLRTTMAHAPGASERLATIVAQGAPGDVAATWVGGRIVAGHGPTGTTAYLSRSTDVNA